MAGGDDVEPIIIIIIQNEHRISSFVPLARRPRATTTPRGRPVLLPSRRSWSFEVLVSKISTSALVAVVFGHVGVPQALFLVCLLDDTRAQRRKKRRKQERVHFCASIGKTTTSRRKKKVRRRTLLLRSRQTTPLSRFVVAFFDSRLCESFGHGTLSTIGSQIPIPNEREKRRGYKTERD